MKLKYTFEMMTLDDEYVAVPVGDGAQNMKGIIKLNETGAAIFKLLTENREENEIIESLTELYNADKNELTRYVHTFIDNLKSEGLLVE